MNILFPISFFFLTLFLPFCGGRELWDVAFNCDTYFAEQSEYVICSHVYVTVVEQKQFK